MTDKTLTIDGIAITLKAGERYLASRPMAKRPPRKYPVHITDGAGRVVLTLSPMTYDDANHFLAEFNNGPTTFDGRVW